MTNYIDNKRFEIVLKRYKRWPRKYEKELVGMLSILIDNIINSFHFNVDREEAKQECYLLCLKVLKNFNRKNGSAFNYFTTIILNNLKLVFSKNKRYREKIEKYLEHYKSRFARQTLR